MFGYQLLCLVLSHRDKWDMAGYAQKACSLKVGISGMDL